MTQSNDINPKVFIGFWATLFGVTLMAAFCISFQKENDKDVLKKVIKSKDVINYHNELIVRKQDSIINTMIYVPKPYKQAFQNWDSIMDAKQNDEPILNVE